MSKGTHLSPLRPALGGAHRRAAGFGMVEVLMAVAVLSVVSLGMVTVLMAGHGNVSQSGRDTAAAVLAQNLAERVWNIPKTTIQDLDLLNGMTTDDPAQCKGGAGTLVNTICTDWIAQVAPPPVGNGTLPQGRGTVSVVLNPSGLNPLTGMDFRQITITVSWAESARGGRSVTAVVGRSD